MLALVILPVAPALAEVMRAMKSGDTVSSCVRPHPTALYSFQAGCKETIVRAGLSSKMSYNKLGLRDKDFTPKPKKGWTRILFIGPSSMAAPGIAESETPPKRLEAILRKTNKKLEVINAGVEGYTNLQLAAITPDLVREYSPTHVILYVSIGPSVNMDLMNEPYLTWVPGGTLTLKQDIFPLSHKFAKLKGWDLREYSNRRRILTIQSASNRAYRTLSCVLRHSAGVERTGCLMQSSLRSVLAIKAQAEAADAQFLFIADSNVSPNHLNLSPGHDFEYASRFDKLTPRVIFDPKHAAELLRKDGVQVELINPERGQDMTLPGDYHFSVAGANSFAELVTNSVQRFLDK